MTLKVLPWLVCALIALISVPTLANGDSHASAENVDGAFITFDNGFYEEGRPLDDNSVSITPGGRVTFSYPTGFSIHNVEFDEDRTRRRAIRPQPAPAPTIGPAPPLPAGSRRRVGGLLPVPDHGPTTSSASRIRT